MVAYSFHPQFVDPISAGLEPGPWVPGMKRQTIRGDRRRHARPGEIVQLYTGMRTRQCRLIGTATCTAVLPITLYLYPPDEGGLVSVRDPGGLYVLHTAGQLDWFARCDGFAGWVAMVGWWRTAHPDVSAFLGTVITWEPLSAADAVALPEA